MALNDPFRQWWDPARRLLGLNSLRLRSAIPETVRKLYCYEHEAQAVPGEDLPQADILEAYERPDLKWHSSASHAVNTGANLGDLWMLAAWRRKFKFMTAHDLTQTLYDQNVDQGAQMGRGAAAKTS